MDGKKLAIRQPISKKKLKIPRVEKSTVIFKNLTILCPKGRDNGNDFSFPVPSPFLKLNDNDVNSFLTGYPIF